MSIIELLLIGIGLSMDAFAVSVCKGLGMTKLNKKNAFLIALFFGGFQALMPWLGWFIGSRFQKYIEQIDHWIAFGPAGYRSAFFDGDCNQLRCFSDRCDFCITAGCKYLDIDRIDRVYYIYDFFCRSRHRFSIWK